MKIRTVWKIIFVTYICLLLYFIVIKFNGSIDRVISIRNSREFGYWNYNLYPFRTIISYLEVISHSYAYKNILGNIASFVPMGFLIPIISKKYINALKTILTSLTCIIGIEIFQFITMLGFFDIDDILLNTFGCIIGYVIYTGFRKLFSKHSYISQNYSNHC